MRCARGGFGTLGAQDFRRREVTVLVVSRREGEALRIGRDIMVTVTRVEGGTVRLGVMAPNGIAIERISLPEPPVERSSPQA